MTAEAMIERLREMPPTAEVRYLWDGELRSTADHVYESKFGDVVIAEQDSVVYSTDSRPIDAPSSEEERYWQTPHVRDEAYDW